MPQHLLQRENVASIAKERNREGVTGSVRGAAGSGDAGDLAQMLEYLQDSRACEGFS